MRFAWPLAGALIFVAAQSAAQSPIKVIAHSSVQVSQVSSEELKGVFLETRTSLADGHVVPVLLRAGVVHAAFVRQHTGKTTAALENYYRSLVFTGKGAMPKMLASDAEMVAYVKITRGAIGYVSAESSTEGVKVLEVN
jgi:ABC-type phosphate transport system substrate-binding protein